MINYKEKDHIRSYIYIYIYIYIYTHPIIKQVKYECCKSPLLQPADRN